MRLPYNGISDSQARSANVSSVRRKGGVQSVEREAFSPSKGRRSVCRKGGHPAGLPTNEDGLRQGHVLSFLSLFFFFSNKNEISEAATITQACIPVHTTLNSQHKARQESDLWVALLF